MFNCVLTAIEAPVDVLILIAVTVFQAFKHAVQQCCVVGYADTDHTQGRLPFVFVVLDPASAGKKRQILRELRQLCREELPEYVQPASSAYKIIPEMPMTPAGKADYRKLEEEVG